MADTSTCEITVRTGTLRGRRTNGVRVFYAIPYAAPPVGPLRFAAPEPAVSWSGVRDATSPGPACPQPASPEGQPGAEFAEMFGTGGLATSEDCLSLNVFSPNGASSDAPLPVMVFIHGGAFRIGTGSLPLYDASALAGRGDVVVVTLNYRLGVLGFLNLPEVGPSNVGLRDQIAALHWVRDNIEAFGGNPGCVTVFGESAGAKSVECLLASPLAQGLFHRAIAESTYEIPMAADGAITAAHRYAAALNTTSPSELRDVPVDALLAEMNNQAMAALLSGGGFASALGGWTPVVDGEVLEHEPLSVFASTSPVPLVLGTTRDEAALFTAMMPMLGQIDETALPTMLGFVLGDGNGVEDLISSYRRSRGIDATPSEIFVAALTDSLFRQHSVRLADTIATTSDAVWMYLFDWESSAPQDTLGACHGLELPFVFGTLSSPLGQIAGAGPDAEQLRSAMQDAWVAFAATGDPSTATLPWPRYDATRRATARLGRELAIVDAPFDIERQAWAARASTPA